MGPSQSNFFLSRVTSMDQLTGSDKAPVTNTNTLQHLALGQHRSLHYAGLMMMRLTATRQLLLLSSSSTCTTRQLIVKRSYGATSLLHEDAAVASTKEDALQRKLAARDFNNRRAAYNRQVSMLRREYAEQVAKQRAADAAEEAERRQKLTRQRLERQRLKNLKSAANALREKEMREQREREFQEHLEVQQRLREAKHKRYTAARQMVIEELEKEAPLWLTTKEEVEKAFTPEAEQLLWTRPGGHLGAPNPSIDTHFWQFETHTWHMNRTYKTQREVLLEHLEEMAYNEANIDPTFWTPKRVLDHEQLEAKARLRAMVHTAGRLELLKKQRDLIDEEESVDAIPKPKNAPSLTVLNNSEALEREGAQLLMNDPTKFFVFEPMNAAVTSNEGDASSTAYEGPTLGSPIGLRDPLRDDSPDGNVFPQVIGKLPKPDMRSEREKKLAEREEKMWAAAQVEAQKELDLSGGGDDDDDREPDLEYDALEWDSDDEEWNRGLDPETDKDILETPRNRRYKEEDIEWVIQRLGEKLTYQEQQFAQHVDNIKDEVRMERRLSATTLGEDSFEDGSLESALLTLPEKQLMALSDLDETYSGEMPAHEFAAAIKDIPGLTEEQVRMVLNRDRSE
jgi:hypothetical protein